MIRWASAWLTSRKLRPLHLMTSLSSWYDLLILWPVKCEWLSYRVRHGNTILRWLIILKQKNLKRKNCDYFHFASFIFSSCLLVKRGISLNFVITNFRPQNDSIAMSDIVVGENSSIWLTSTIWGGVSVFFIILDWFVSFNFSIFALVSFNLIGKYSRCTVNGKYQWQLELLEVFENHLSTSIRIPPSSENLE